MQNESSDENAGFWTMNTGEHGTDTRMSVTTMCSLDEYPPGLIGVVTALFGRCIAASHYINWTLDVMIAEQQCEFFRRFDPTRDRVWIALEEGVPRGALTIDGPRIESGREFARLRFFILDEKFRGRGIGRRIVAEAMQYCRQQGYPGVFLTTLPGLDAALHLYKEQGFTLAHQSSETFHGSPYIEQTWECKFVS
jgi:GNAT superfamily N-acetyltransferase